MSEFAIKLAAEQRARLVGSVLGYAERDIYAKLTAAERKAFREKVLSSVGVYHDFVLDCLRASTDDSTVINTEALQLLHDIKTAVRRPAVANRNDLSA